MAGSSETVGEPVSKGDDAPPTAAEVGNHHWPVVTNVFAGHGSKFPKHHSHPGITVAEMRRKHVSLDTSGLNPDHDKGAAFHQAMDVDGCRL